jgi:4-hydroxy-2-oxoheptanedioate aldolase
MAASGVDAVVIDMQHGSATLDDIIALAACIEVRGAEPFVRVPTIDPGLIGRSLDAGATGIIAPLVESAEQARAFVEALLYPPEGRRSYGPRIPSLRYGSNYVLGANRQVVGLAMVETVEGLAAIDAIAAVEGLAGIFVGPSDLAISMGFPPPQAEEPRPVEEAIERIRSRVVATGKRAGIFCPTSLKAEKAVNAGFDLVTTQSDVGLIDVGTRSSLAQLRSLVASG